MIGGDYLGPDPVCQRKTEAIGERYAGNFSLVPTGLPPECVVHVFADCQVDRKYILHNAFCPFYTFSPPKVVVNFTQIHGVDEAIVLRIT
jgi:hypothetical protein